MSWLRVVRKRLLSHPWLITMYILSVALCIAVFASPSLFADAVNQAIMRDELNKSAEAFNRPTLAIRFYATPTSNRAMDLQISEQVRAWLKQALEDGLGLPIRSIYVQNESPILRLLALEGDTRYSHRDLAYTTAIVVPEISSRLQTLAGAPYGSINTPDTLDVWVFPAIADTLGLSVGEEYLLSYTSRDAPVTIRIAGIVQAADKNDEFWYWNPDKLFDGDFLVTEAGYETYLAPLFPEGINYLFWYFVVDDSQLNLSHAARYIEVLERTKLSVSEYLPEGRMDPAPLESLVRARQRKLGLSIVLTALTIPLMVVLLQFSALVSAIYTRSSARQDAMVMSRGASRIQLLLISLTETLVCLLIALPLGLFGGIQTARLLGLADGFLSFGASTAPRAYLAALDWLPVVLIAAVSLVIRLWVTGRQAGVSIVAYEHRSTGRKLVTAGMRLVFVAFLAAATIYAYRQLVAVGGVPLVMQPDQATYPDPLLLFAPSLFILVASLVLAESTSWLLGLFVAVLEPFLPATVLVVLRQMSREQSRTRGPVFLLVISLSLGVFYASLAHSAQLWLRDHLRHVVGTDIALQLAVVDTGPAFRPPTEEFENPTLAGKDSWQLPAEEYERIEGVVRATRVADFGADARLAGRERRVKLLGIERLSFPQTAYTRSDYASVPFGELMNRLALNPQGALIPEKAAREFNLKNGDRIPIKYTLEDTTYPLDYIVVGTYDYFPSVDENEYAVVVNIASIFEGVGRIVPHSIWMRTAPGADPRAILEAIENQGIVAIEIQVLADVLDSETGSREYAGILGMMSLSFLASLTAALAGTLVQLFASLSRQRVTFALMHGIGFQLSSITASVLLEYVLIVISGVTWGGLAGTLAVRLYGRFYPLIAAADNVVPPFAARYDPGIAWWLVAVVLAISVVVLALIAVFFKRQRIFESLRLGQSQ